jgi:hypothetical protein
MLQNIAFLDYFAESFAWESAKAAKNELLCRSVARSQPLSRPVEKSPPLVLDQEHCLRRGTGGLGADDPDAAVEHLGIEEGTDQLLVGAVAQRLRLAQRIRVRGGRPKDIRATDSTRLRSSAPFIRARAYSINPQNRSTATWSPTYDRPPRAKLANAVQTPRSADRDEVRRARVDVGRIAKLGDLVDEADNEVSSECIDRELLSLRWPVGNL